MLPGLAAGCCACSLDFPEEVFESGEEASWIELPTEVARAPVGAGLCAIAVDMPNHKTPARQSIQRWFVSEEFPILADDTPRAYKQHPQFDVRLGINDLQTINKCSCSRTGRSKIIRCTSTKSDFFRRGKEGSDYRSPEVLTGDAGGSQIQSRAYKRLQVKHLLR